MCCLLEKSSTYKITVKFSKSLEETIEHVYIIMSIFSSIYLLDELVSEEQRNFYCGTRAKK